ncbi:hypothetical protein [Candidatus Enterococcus clewellii]|uniref:ASCH domain-containing protein n=1 Tax=Candidatus Enterococcus clewellii TaxID=1834193 RepID=A0A242KC38_9ENTE|nr:hypothetical protein [Enterococcus sp. 9E7_DIV0242]OTP18348.1 hypothetical protein A5888_000162 [Enterococcus sp. 9E7_DIV0242]
MEHLVYTDAKSKVFDKIMAGEKTLIVRGAAGRKLPHSRVFVGETLYFIENNGSGEIKGTAIVKSVFNSEKMTAEESTEILEGKQDQLQLSAAQKKRWYGKKILCLIEIEQPKLIEPMYLDRQKNMDDWLIIENIGDITVEGNAEEYKNIRLNK